MAAVLGSEPLSARPVGGGDVCSAYRVELADGRAVFGKTRTPAVPGFFAVEVAGLRWLGEPSARIHGDLWSGNVLWSADGEPRLVDPAAHGGHRETDLAMLALFGAPYLSRILAAYHDAFPLADGWRERVTLHQIHPLLVHAVLFGGGYGAQAGAVARNVRTTS